MSLHTQPVKLRVYIDVTYLPNGVPTFALVNGLEAMVHRAIGNGGLTGDTPEAEVETHEYKVVEVPEPLSEEELSAFMLERIENGSLDLKDLPVRLARYGLMEPHAFVAEMRERMENQAANSDDGEPDFETEIVAVLTAHSLRVANSGGKSFESMAAELQAELDEDTVDVAEDRAAEIERQLVAMGVLEAPKSAEFELLEVPIGGVYPFEVGSRVGSMLVVHTFAVTLDGAKRAAQGLRKKMGDVDLVIRQFTGTEQGITDVCPPWIRPEGEERPTQLAHWMGSGDPPYMNSVVTPKNTTHGAGVVTGFTIIGGYLHVMHQAVNADARTDEWKAINPANDPVPLSGSELG